MAGSPTFSTAAATVLVDAYLAQPEGSRDLRKVLAAAKQGTLQSPWLKSMDPKEIHWSPHEPLPVQERAELDPSVVAEIAAMSQSQAYELLRADSRYQPTTSEKADELCAENLELAREIIASEKEKPPYLRDVTRLKEAQSLIGMVEWQKHRYKRPVDVPTGLAGLVG